MFAVVILLVAQLGQVSLFEGDWKSDVPNMRGSSIGSVPSGVSFVVTRDKVTITDHQVTPEGKELKAFSLAYETDGRPHPSPTGPGWTVVAKWTSPYVLDLMDTGRG